MQRTHPRTVRRSLALVAILNVLWAGSAAAGTADVEVRSNVFDPDTVQVVEGDSVTWNNTGGTHNVNADDGSFRCANGCDGDGGNGTPAAGWTATVTFSTAGSFPYHCQVHGGSGGVGMSGTVEVLAREIFADSFESGDLDAWTTSVGG